ncbi:hypothetical protein E8E11_011481 [Didymella keratinophila]|nr:hypothetical protein E8E11_011481 [Didymella keratinophila]
MSMMVTGTSRRQEYLDTYGSAIQGLGTVLDGYSGPVGSTVAIAGMCLALSEAYVPTSHQGYNTHLRGVAAMMQSRDPSAFIEGVAHLMFAGVRPLIVIDAVIRRKSTFLMELRWQSVPSAVHRATRMQVLLSHATAIPPLLEAIDSDTVDMQLVQTGLLKILDKLQDWEESFVADNMLHQSVNPVHFGLPVDSLLLPDPCLSFLDVSHANCLTHCWAFRIVCLTELARLGISEASGTMNALGAEFDCQAEVEDLGYKICRALPFLLQKDMSLYGSMSAGYPLQVILESLRMMQLEDRNLITWTTTIKEHIQNLNMVLYEDMVGPVSST